MIPAKRFLVAGGAGFIGSHLVRRLLREASTEEITVIDNFSTGDPANLAEVKDDPRITVLTVDITEPLHHHAKYDWVLHLAAIANPTDYEKSPLETFHVNSRGNEQLIRLAARAEARYAFFSSSEVYGYYRQIPRGGLREDTMSHLVLNQARSPYPVGKCFGEEITKYLADRYGVPYVIIRPFNVYGPDMDIKTNYGRVIPNFIRWALSAESLKVQGDGRQIRTFCHIDDFIEALMIVLQHPAPPTVLNIGSPIPTPVLTLAKLVNRLTGNTAGIEFVEKYPYETFSRIPDIRRIRSLGWRPGSNWKKASAKPSTGSKAAPLRLPGPGHQNILPA